MIKNRQNNLDKQIQNVSSSNCSQQQLWKLIEESAIDIEVIKAIKSIKNNKNVCDLRDEKGRHIVQFAMIHNPSLIETILSIDKKILTLTSTPDEHGRLPSIYWIASGEAQNFISKLNLTAELIPKQIDEEAWRQAAGLAYELGLNSIGFCSRKVQKNFEETTGKKFDEWIEKEAANGNPWFEHMIDIAVERAKKGLSSPIFLYSDAIETWSDPDNPRVVNEAHALFRAHLMLANYLAYSEPISNNVKIQSIEKFLKAHFSGKDFVTIRNQINDGISFMGSYNCKSLVKSQWWKKICTIMERELLLKKYDEMTKIAMPSTAIKTL